MRSGPSRAWQAAGVLWAAVAVFIWVGFLFGRSRAPLLFSYSGTYLLFLAILPVVLVSPAGLVWLARRLGWRRFARDAGPTIGAIVLVYLAAAGVYYQQQTHLFDPYTQAPGQRIQDLDRSTRPGEVRIAALGGSTTAAPTLAPEDRYPARLERALVAAGIDAVVFNGGQNWWTSRHSLIHYVSYVRHWRPDVVTIMHTINDVYRSCSPPDYSVGAYDDLYAHFYGASILGARPPTFVEAVLAGPLRLASQQWYRPWRRREVDMPVSRFVSIAAYERHLHTLVQVIRGDGASPILLTEPSLFTARPGPAEVAVMRFGEEFCLTPTGWLTADYPSSASLQAVMTAFNDVVRRTAAALAVPLVDLDPALPRTLQYFIDDVHYTPRGAAEVADRVRPAVEAELSRRAADGPPPGAP